MLLRQRLHDPISSQKPPAELNHNLLPQQYGIYIYIDMLNGSDRQINDMVVEDISEAPDFP